MNQRNADRSQWAAVAGSALLDEAALRGVT